MVTDPSSVAPTVRTSTLATQGGKSGVDRRLVRWRRCWRDERLARASFLCGGREMIKVLPVADRDRARIHSPRAPDAPLGGDGPALRDHESAVGHATTARHREARGSGVSP